MGAITGYFCYQPFTICLFCLMGSAIDLFYYQLPTISRFCLIDAITGPIYYWPLTIIFFCLIGFAIGFFLLPTSIIMIALSISWVSLPGLLLLALSCYLSFAIGLTFWLCYPPYLPHGSNYWPFPLSRIC